MFLVKNNKSTFYQIVYFVNGKRTTHSTKKTTKSKAILYLKDFEKNLSNPLTETPSVTQETLSDFKDEYLEYAKPVKTKNIQIPLRILSNTLLNMSVMFP